MGHHDTGFVNIYHELLAFILVIIELDREVISRDKNA